MGRRRKKSIPNVVITGMADKGKAVGRDDEGMVVFVEGAVPGDRLDVLGLRKKKGFWNGVPEKFIEYSPDRTDPRCKHFGNCGGCKWQNLTYEAQLRHKHKIVTDAFQRLAKVEVGETHDILGAEKVFNYRNKLTYSFTNLRWVPQEVLDSGVEVDFSNGLGFFRAGSFSKVVNIEQCHLQEDETNRIRNYVKEYALKNELTFHNPFKHEGFLRNIILRSNRKGEWMFIIVIYEENMEVISDLLESIDNEFQEINSCWYCVNPKMNDSIHDLEVKHFSGERYLSESLGDVQFNVGPKSFFQTNTFQAERLYESIREFADFDGHENVYDLYTGLGSIALFVAKHCKQVVGIEEIEAAIEDAKMNTQLNGIDNAVFYAGDVKNILTDEFANKHGKPDLLITDPPRAGMHEDVVKMLLKLEAPKIVYVSCNPATQARDIKLLDEKYRVKKIRPVDMFPHTNHVENVALLELKLDE